MRTITGTMINSISRVDAMTSLPCCEATSPGGLSTIRPQPDSRSGQESEITPRIFLIEVMPAPEVHSLCSWRQSIACWAASQFQLRYESERGCFEAGHAARLDRRLMD